MEGIVDELASLHHNEAALLFSSCYVANEAAISTLARALPGCILFSDELNHASMIAGIRHSGCEKRIYRHNDVAHLEEILKELPKAAPKRRLGRVRARGDTEGYLPGFVYPGASGICLTEVG